MEYVLNSSNLRGKYKKKKEKPKKQNKPKKYIDNDFKVSIFTYLSELLDLN